MPTLFKVIRIIDGDTIETNGWKLGEEYFGRKVKISGFEFANKKLKDFAKSKLEILLKNESIELRNPVNPQKFGEKDDLITASVYLNDIDILQYFPELKETENS